MRTLENEAKQELFAHLDVVDTKLQTLLGFNAILIAILVILFTSERADVAPETPLEIVTFFFSFLLVTLSISFCARMVFLTGSHVRKTKDPKTYLDRLYLASYSRTRDYARSFWLALLAFLMFAICIFSIFIGTPEFRNLIPIPTPGR